MSAVKDDLIKAVQAKLAADDIKVQKKEAEQFIAAVLGGLLEVCQEKESIRTVLGTFRWAHTDTRERINPRTGAPVTVEAYSTLKFRPGKTVRVLDSELKKPAKKAPAAKAAATAKAPAKAAAKPAVKKVAAKK